MKYERMSQQAAELYTNGMSVDAVASELGIAYRTARKAIWAQGVEFRDPSARLVGRTRPDKTTTSEQA